MINTLLILFILINLFIFYIIWGIMIVNKEIHKENSGWVTDYRENEDDKGDN